MSNDIQKEHDKYLVMKWDYLLGFLTVEQVRDLTTLLNIANEERKRRGFPDNRYIVCNQDEPYAEKVWQMILDGEREKKAKEVTDEKHIRRLK